MFLINLFRTVSVVGNYSFKGKDDVVTCYVSFNKFGVFFSTGATALYSVTLTTSVLTIGNGAFTNCGLTSLVLPTSVTYVDQVSKHFLLSYTLIVCKQRLIIYIHHI